MEISITVHLSATCKLWLYSSMCLELMEMFRCIRDTVPIGLVTYFLNSGNCEYSRVLFLRLFFFLNQIWKWVFFSSGIVIVVYGILRVGKMPC